MMYSLASDFFEKTIHIYFKPDSRFMCKKFLALRYVFTVFFLNKSDAKLKILKTRV